MQKNYRSELVGVLGDPVDGNPTGVMEEAGFAANNLKYRYITVRVLPKDLEEAIKGVRAFGMKGVNLTMPHKVLVIPYLDELSPAAKMIGAVNTVINRNGKLIGENTDGKGFTASLHKEGVVISGKNIVLLGAGGAAKAIAVECVLAGAGKVLVINRNEERGQVLAALLKENSNCEVNYLKWQGKMEVPQGTDILINATSIGLLPDIDRKPDIDYASVNNHMTVCDVIFNPIDPLFLQEARKRGAKTINGIGMLVHQGALNYTLWTGEEAPIDIMYHALEKEFGGKSI